MAKGLPMRSSLSTKSLITRGPPGLSALRILRKMSRLSSRVRKHPASRLPRNQQGHFRANFLGDLLDPAIIFRNSLVQGFDFPLQSIPQLLVQPFGGLSIHLPGAALLQPLAVRFR